MAAWATDTPMFLFEGEQGKRRSRVFFALKALQPTGTWKTQHRVQKKGIRTAPPV